MIKKLFLDTETTGADPKRHALFQIAGVIEIDGCAKEEFDLTMSPHEGAEFDRLVMSKHGLTKEKLMEFPSPKQVYEEFIEILSTYIDRYNPEDKFWFIGYVAFFDDRFLRAFFERMKDVYYGSWFHYPVIDVCTLAGYKLMKERSNLVNFKLGSLAEYLGIRVAKEKQHTALYDAYLARTVLQELEKR